MWSSVLLVRNAKMRSTMCQKSTSNVRDRRIQDGAKPEVAKKAKKAAKLLEVDA